jgi:AcrR family transcriptional regulator
MSGSVAVRPAESERQRLLAAMARVVGRRGYRAASVAEVIAEAESCRATFDRHFADKEECFCAAHARLVECTLEAVSESLDPQRPWLQRVSAGLERLIELCENNPELARAALVETDAAGAEGQRCALAATERFAELFAPDAELAEQLPPRAALMAASGVAGLIGDQLRHGEGPAGLLPELTFALLVPLTGPAAASEQMALVGPEVARGRALHHQMKA